MPLARPAFAECRRRPSLAVSGAVEVMHNPCGGDLDLDAIPVVRLEREVVRRLSRRSDARGLVQLSSHLALLAASGWVGFAARRLWLLPALVLHGAILSFLFCALHECIHRTAFASRRLNDTVAAVCGAVLVLPPEYFRLFHFAHHRHTQQPARDPELAV